MPTSLGELVIQFSGNMSGLERDLEQAKKYAKICGQRIEKEFQRTFAKSVLMPRVDHKELNALNKHLDLKRKHHKQLQKYFDANPLKIRVEYDEDKTSKPPKSGGKQQTASRQTTTQRRVSKPQSDAFRTTTRELEKSSVSIGTKIGQSIGKFLAGSFGKKIGGNIGKSVGQEAGKLFRDDIEKGFTQGSKKVSKASGRSGFYRKNVSDDSVLKAVNRLSQKQTEIGKEWDPTKDLVDAIEEGFKKGFPDFGEEASEALRKGLKEGFKGSMTGNLFKALFAPFKQIASGAFEGIGMQITKDLGAGLSQGLETSLSSFIGGFEHVGERLGKELSNQLLATFGETALNIQDAMQAALGPEARVAAVATRGKEYKRAAQIGDLAEKQSRVEIELYKKRRLFLEKENQLIKQSQETLKNYAELFDEQLESSIKKATGPTVKLIEDLDEQISEVVSREAETPQETARRAYDLQRLRTKRGYLVERQDRETREATSRLEPERQRILALRDELSSQKFLFSQKLQPFAPETQDFLARQLQKYPAYEKLEEKQLKVRQRKEQGTGHQTLFKDIFESVVKESGLTMEDVAGKIPTPVAGPELPDTDARFLVGTNQIKVAQSIIDKLESGDLGQLGQKEIGTLAHEMRHSLQHSAKAQLQLIKATKENAEVVKDLSRNIEHSIRVGVKSGVKREEVREKEIDAYLFERLQTPQVQQRLEAEQKRSEVSGKLGFRGANVAEDLKRIQGKVELFKEAGKARGRTDLEGVLNALTNKINITTQQINDLVSEVAEIEELDSIDLDWVTQVAENTDKQIESLNKLGSIIETIGVSEFQLKPQKKVSAREELEKEQKQIKQEQDELLFYDPAVREALGIQESLTESFRGLQGFEKREAAVAQKKRVFSREVSREVARKQGKFNLQEDLATPIYQNILKEVAGLSGISKVAQVPGIIQPQEQLKKGEGFYNPKLNVLELETELFQKVLNEELENASNEQIKDAASLLTHELRHAAQLGFGGFSEGDLAKAFKQGDPLPVQLLEGTEDELKRINKAVAASVESYTGTLPKELVKRLEEDAYIFELRYYKDIEKIISKNLNKADLDFEALKALEDLPTPDLENLPALSDDLWAEMEEASQNLDKAAEIAQNLPNVTDKFADQFAALDKELAAKAQVTPEKLEKEYTTQGLREVAKRMGVKNKGSAPKAELIKVIKELEETRKDELDTLIKSLGDSIKKVGSQTGQGSTLPTIDEDVIAKQLKAEISKLATVSQEVESTDLRKLVDTIDSQLKWLEELNTQFALSGKTAQQVSGYRSTLEQLRKQPAAHAQLIETLTSQQGAGRFARKDLDAEDDISKAENEVERLKVLLEKFNLELLKAQQRADKGKGEYKTIGTQVRPKYQGKDPFQKAQNVGERIEDQLQIVDEVMVDAEERIAGSTQAIQNELDNMSEGVETTTDRISRLYKIFIKDLEERAPGLKNFLDPVIGSFKNLGNFILGFTAFQTITSMVQTMIPALHRAGRELESLEIRFEFLSDNVVEAQKTFEKIKNTAQDLGVDVRSASEGFIGLAASTRDTVLEGQATEQIFNAMTQASAVFALSAEQTEGAYVALEQIASKGKVQAEELRGQLAERIPGAFQIAARAMGVTTQELNKMLERGEVLSEDFLPKFAAQLSAESAVGVAGAANSSQAALNRFNNTLFLLQGNLGKKLLPAKNLGLDVLSKAMGFVVEHGETFTRLISFIIALLGQKLVFAAFSAAKAMGLMNLAMLSPSGIMGAIKAVLPALGKLVIQFAVFDSAIKLFKLLGRAFGDASGKIKEFEKASTKAIEKYKQLVSPESVQAATKPRAATLFTDTFLGFLPKEAEIGDSLAKRLGAGIGRAFAGAENFLAKQVAGRGFNIISGKGFQAGITYGERVLQQQLITIRNIQQAADFASGEGFSLIGMGEGSAEIKLIQDLNKDLDVNLRQRRAIAELDPGNEKRIKALDEERDVILQNLEAARERPAAVQALLRSQIGSLESLIKDLEIKAATPGLGQEQFGQELELARSKQERLVKQYDNLVKLTGEGTNKFSLMRKEVERIADKLADAATQSERMSNSAKTVLAQQQLSGQVTTGQVQAGQQQIEINRVAQDLNASVNAFNQLQSLLNTEENRKVLATYGVNINTGQEELQRLAEKLRDASAQDAARIEWLSQLKQYGTDIAARTAELAQAQVEARTQLQESTRAVVDFYLQVDRQSQELVLSVEQTNIENKFKDQRRRLEAAIGGFGDSFVDDFVNYILEDLDSRMQEQIDTVALEQEQLNSRYSYQELEKQALELRRNIPELPTIPVTLDFSGVPTDADLQKLNDDVDSTVVATGHLADMTTLFKNGVVKSTEALENTVYKTENLNAELGKTSPMTDAFKEALEHTTTQANELQESLKGTQDATASMTDNLDNAGGFLDGLITKAQQLGTDLNDAFLKWVGIGTKQTQAGLGGFAEALTGAGPQNQKTSKTRDYGGFKIVESVGSRLENVNRYEDLEKHHPSSGRERGRTYRTVEGKLEEVNSKVTSLVKKDFVLLGKGGRQDVATPSPVSGYAKRSGGLDRYGGVEIYSDKEMTDLIARALHLENIQVKSGQYVEYGQNLGTQGGAGGYPVHSHIELDPTTFRKYIQDLRDGTFEAISGGANQALDKGVLWGKAGKYEQSDLSGLTGQGKKAMEALKNKNVRAYLDAVAIAELGKSGAQAGGYGKWVGDYGTAETHDPNKLVRHPGRARQGSTATGRYQFLDFTWAEEKQKLGLKDFKPQSQELAAVGRLMMRGALDAVKKGDFDTAFKKTMPEWASLNVGGVGSYQGQKTGGGEQATFTQNVAKAANVIARQSANVQSPQQEIISAQEQKMVVDQAVNQAQRNMVTEQTAAAERLRKSQEIERQRRENNLTAAIRGLEQGIIEAERGTVQAERQLRDLGFEGQVQTPEVAFQRDLVQGRDQLEDTLAEIDQRILTFENTLGKLSGLLGKEGVTPEQKQLIQGTLARYTENLEKVRANREAVIQESKELEQFRKSEFQRQQENLRFENDIALKRQQIAEQQLTLEISRTQGFDLVANALERELSAQERQITLTEELRRIEEARRTGQLTGSEAGDQADQLQRNFDIQNQILQFQRQQESAERNRQLKLTEDQLQIEYARAQGLESRGAQLDYQLQKQQQELEIQRQISEIEELRRQGLISGEAAKAEVNQLTRNFQLQQNILEVTRQRQQVERERAIQQQLGQSELGLLDAQISHLSGGGQTFAANILGEQRALMEQETNFAQQKFELEEFIRTNAVATEEADKLRENLDKVNQVSLANIQQQFHPFREQLSSLQGALSGLISSGLKGEGDALDNFLDHITDSVIDTFADLSTQLLFGGIFGAGGPAAGPRTGGKGLFGGLIDSLLGSVGSISFFNRGGVIGKGGQQASSLTEAFRRERSGGGQPRLVVANDQEAILDSETTRALLDVLQGSVPYYNKGNTQGRKIAKAISKSASSGSGQVTIKIDSNTHVINNQEYVTKTDYEQGLQKAVAEGAKIGQQNTYNSIRNSMATRKNLGM